MITSFGFFAILALFKWCWPGSLPGAEEVRVGFPIEISEASGFIVKIYGIFVGGNAVSKIPEMFRGKSHGGKMDTD